MILGIDPATKTGYCVMANNGEIVTAGTWDLNQPIPKVERGTKLLRFQTLLASVVLDKAHDSLHTIACERVFQHTSEDQTRMYGGLVAVIEMMAARHGLRAVGVACPTIKKRATGSGRAEKRAVLAAARAKWGMVHDDNQADAMWIAEVARTNERKGT